jgi:hypothetical protein
MPRAQLPTPRVPVVERACQLAGAGMAIREIRVVLKSEGYTFVEIGGYLDGSTMLATLRSLAAGAVKPDDGQ